jgi:hypothetical protein
VRLHLDALDRATKDDELRSRTLSPATHESEIELRRAPALLIEDQRRPAIPTIEKDDDNYGTDQIADSEGRVGGGTVEEISNSSGGREAITGNSGSRTSLIPGSLHRDASEDVPGNLVGRDDTDTSIPLSKSSCHTPGLAEQAAITSNSHAKEPQVDAYGSDESMVEQSGLRILRRDSPPTGLSDNESVRECNRVPPYITYDDDETSVTRKWHTSTKSAATRSTTLDERAESTMDLSHEAATDSDDQSGLTSPARSSIGVPTPQADTSFGGTHSPGLRTPRSNSRRDLRGMKRHHVSSSSERDKRAKTPKTSGQTCDS